MQRRRYRQMAWVGEALTRPARIFKGWASALDDYNGFQYPEEILIRDEMVRA